MQLVWRTVRWKSQTTISPRDQKVVLTYGDRPVLCSKQVCKEKQAAVALVMEPSLKSRQVSTSQSPIFLHSLLWSCVGECKCSLDPFSAHKLGVNSSWGFLQAPHMLQFSKGWSRSPLWEYFMRHEWEPKLIIPSPIETHREAPHRRQQMEL